MRLLENKLVKHFTFIATCMLLIYCFTIQYNKLQLITGIDYFSFWAVPHIHSVVPVSNHYNEQDQRSMYHMLKDEAASTGISEKQRIATVAISEFNYNTLYATASPFLYAIVGSLSSGEYDSDVFMYSALSTICSILSVIILCNLLKFKSTITIVLLIYYITFFAPLQCDLRVGNVNQIQLLFISVFIFLMARSKLLLAGLILGVSFVFKPNIFMIFLLLGLITIIDRSYKNYSPLFIGSGIGMTISVLYASWYFGRLNIWADFIQSLPKTLSGDIPISYGNFSLTMLIQKSTDIKSSIYILFILLSVFIYIIYFTGTKYNLKDELYNNGCVQHIMDEAFIAASLGMTIMLLSLKVIWYHYFVFTIPLSIYLLRPVEIEAISKIHHLIIRSVTIISLFLGSRFFENIFFFKPVNLSFTLNISTLIITSAALYDFAATRRVCLINKDGVPQKTIIPE